MNRSAKIILLVLAIILAVGGVMVFYKTIVSPPGKLDFNNQFVASTKKDVDNAKNAKGDSSLDSVYTAVTHEIAFQISNKLIADEDGDELLQSFVENYVPGYVNNCNKKFSQEVWSEEVLNKMQKHISELNALRTSEGKPVVSGEASTSLNDVNNVIIDYYLAQKACIVGGFTGLANARSKIANADDFLNEEKHPYINKCKSLNASLKDVRSKLEKAHYSYLVGQVERLRSANGMSMSSYDALSDEVSKKISEYKDNANRVYRKKSSTDVLEKRAKEYYGNVMEAF